MIAEVVSVGTELLLGQTVDTNAAALGRRLADLGIHHRHRQTVGDNLERATRAIEAALQRADIVLTIGGLGPTEDDLTRDAIAAAVGLPLVPDTTIEAHLREVFERRRLPWVDSQLRQALLPAGARPLLNPNGTAPGIMLEHADKVIIALPGPPGEFNPMLEGPVTEFLSTRGGGQTLFSRVLRVCGMGESIVEERIRDLLHLDSPTVAPYAKLGEVHLRVTARVPSRAAGEAAVADVVDEIYARLGTHVYGEGETTLEAAVLAQLIRQRATVAVAESLTGGELSARLSAPAGASEAFRGGVIVYTAEAKSRLLGMDAEVLEQFGAVSVAAAQAMAENVRATLNAQYGLALTGNAGPTVDTPGTQVGRVYLALATDNGTDVSTYDFPGTRQDVRRRSTQAALVRLREALLDAEDAT